GGAAPLGRGAVGVGRAGAAGGRAQAPLAEGPGRAHQLLAKIALARNNLAEAERQARLSMDEPATRGEGAMSLAEVLVRKSELREALGVLDAARAEATAEKRAPQAGLGELRADVLGRLGRFTEAEAGLRDEIRSSRARAQTYASLAVIVALQRRPRAEVHEILDSMERAYPGRETLLLGAKTLDFLGDNDAAREW